MKSFRTSAHRHYRALTLLEMLLALGLLSAVAGLLVSWLTVASGSAAVAGKAVSWEVAATRVLSLIHDDLVNVEIEPTDRRSDEPRVTAGTGELVVRTRMGSGQVNVRYVVDAAGVLRRGSTGSATGKALLSDVAAFRCQVDEESRVLRVSIECLVSDISVTRSYRAP